MCHLSPYASGINYFTGELSRPFAWMYIHKADQPRTINAIQCSAACTAKGLCPIMPRQPRKSLLTVQLSCMDQLRGRLASLPECLKKMAKQDRKKSSCRAEDSAEVDSGKETTFLRYQARSVAFKCLMLACFLSATRLLEAGTYPFRPPLCCSQDHSSASLSRHSYLLSPE